MRVGIRHINEDVAVKAALDKVNEMASLASEAEGEAQQVGEALQEIRKRSTLERAAESLLHSGDFGEANRAVNASEEEHLLASRRSRIAKRAQGMALRELHDARKRVSRHVLEQLEPERAERAKATFVALRDFLRVRVNEASLYRELREAGYELSGSEVSWLPVAKLSAAVDEARERGYISESLRNELRQLLEDANRH